MTRLLNLLVLFLNVLVLIGGQLPNDFSNTQNYGNLVYMLIIAIAMLGITDITQWILDKILPRLPYKENIVINSISPVIGICVAFVIIFIVGLGKYIKNMLYF